MVPRCLAGEERVPPAHGALVCLPIELLRFVPAAKLVGKHPRPVVRPVAIVIVLITAVSALRVFDLVQTMTGGGPFFASEVMEVYIYRNAFSVLGGTPRLGYASAAGVLFGLTVMLVALSQAWALRWARRVRGDFGGRL